MAERRPTLAEAGREIAYDLEVFRRLESIAEEKLERRRYDSAAAWAQIAADYAWHNHPGVLTSPRLETVLGEIGRLKVPVPREPKWTELLSAPPQRVLHVMTEANEIGGHTRLAWRWMELDRKRSHSLLLTRASESGVPPPLHEAVRASGGQIRTLRESRGRLVARARELRETAASYDAVVLHVHPFDVLPGIAFAERPFGPPTVLVNHADHVFWVGTGVADTVACIRGSGLRLALERRGLSAAMCTLLPIPVPPATRTFTRAEAKRALGLPGDSVLLLTVAQAQKYAPIEGVNLPDLVTPVVEAHPEAVLLAVGPLPVGEWKDAADRTDGRIRALGTSLDVVRFYEAADVYLDSYPFASLTSLLEAASFGAPVVSFRPRGPEDDVLGADDPAFGDGFFAPASLAEYRSTLSGLISDRSAREANGAAAWAGVEKVHSGAGWAANLEEVYVCARRGGHAASLTTATAEQTTTLDVLLARLHRASGWSIPLHEVVRSHVDCLSAPASAWARILAARQLIRFAGGQERGHRLKRWLFTSREAV